jgi:hypothetical protein
MILLVISFLMVAGPYMLLKGAIIPKKQLGQFASIAQTDTVLRIGEQIASNIKYTAGFGPLDVIRAFGRLFQNLGETLMWFFLPALFVGFYHGCRKNTHYEPRQFFMSAIVSLNIALMIWLYCKCGYMSVRHSLPLVVFTIFYVPWGIDVLSHRFHKCSTEKTCWMAGTTGSVDSRFVVLMVVGIVICTPKLLRPLHYDKLILREAAEWLAKNTQENNLIAIPDPRISFYSNRNGILYDNQEVPDEAEYIVEIFKSRKDLETSEEFSGEERVFSAKSEERGNKIVIYRKSGYLKSD